MFENHCSINVYSMCNWQMWHCWVCPLVACLGSYILHPQQYLLVCACLIWNGYSFEARDWLLGRLFCLSAVFPSIRSFLFSEPPTLPSKPSAPVYFHVDTQHTHRIKMFAHTSLHNFYCGLFTGWLLGHPSYHYPHTTEEYCVKARAHS